jgi:hypothetical protein
VLKVTVCWGAAPCSLVKTDDGVGGLFCLHYEDGLYDITAAVYQNVAVVNIGNLTGVRIT